MKPIALLFMLSAIGAFAQPATLNPPATQAPGRGGGRGQANRTQVESLGPTPRVALLVGEKNAGSLAIIDPVKLEIVARIPVENQPHEVATDGTYAYVGNAGGSSVVVVNVAEQKREPSIPTGIFGSFHGLNVVNGKLYISHERTRMITRFDPATQKFDWALGTGGGSHLLLITPDERTIFTANSNTALITILEAGAGRGGTAAPAAATAAAPVTGGGTNWRFTSFPGDTRLEGMALSPDGRELWVVNMNVRPMTMTVINVPEKKLVETFPLRTVFTNRMKFTHDGKHVLMNELQGTELIVMDAASRKEVKRIDVGAGGEGIFMDPDGTRAFYAVSNGNKIAVIDIKTFTVVKEITGLMNPDGMAWYVAK